MSLSREVTTFPLNHDVLGKLLQAGLSTSAACETLNASSLSSSTRMPPEQAEQVLKTLCANSSTCGPKMFNAKSALDLFVEELERDHIVTFCEALDSMLGGGVPLGHMTELSGSPGTGKTQLCMQLAVSAHIPVSLGGVEGETVYIDTEGSLVAERLVEIAKSTVAHCQQVSAAQGLDQNCVSVDRILAGIHCFRCRDYFELMATVKLLPTFLNENRKVKLVIVDSLASPFRHNLDDMTLRRRLLTTLAQSFHKIIAEYKIAVVLTNQMTTKISSKEGDSHCIPALGEHWAHVPTNRVVLMSSHRHREALLYKAPNKKETKCSFHITDDGVRDVP